MAEKVEPLHTYEIEFFCGNCNKSQKEKIPKGTFVIDFDYVCKNCGITKIEVEKKAKLMRGLGVPGVNYNG